MGSLSKCLPVSLKYEGGWSDHPRDPGGATMKGVTLATFRRYHPRATKADLRAISQADLERIYRDGYWDKIGGDALPDGVALVAFDLAINSGPARARRYLAETKGVPDPAERVKAICRRREDFLRGLGTFDVFGRGWMRRVHDVQALALKWCAQPEADDDEATPGVKDVQRLLREKGYFEGGAADGVLGPRTKAAIVAFRAENGLSETPTIDDDLMRALALSGSREIPETRATATADDLRDKGSETIAAADNIGLLAKVGAAGTMVKAATDGVSPTLDAISGVKSLSETISDLGTWAIEHWWLVAGAALLAVIWVERCKIISARVEDHRTAANMGR